MFQIISMWNLTRPDQEIAETVTNIKLRGYNEDTFLTGEFAWKIAEGKLRPLSVSNIADKYCPSRRDLYFYKGINRPPSLGNLPSWGGKAGYLVEEYVKMIIDRTKNSMDNFSNYDSLLSNSDDNHQYFLTLRSKNIKELKNLEEETDVIKQGDTDWLLKLLKSNGRAELAINFLHGMLKEEASLNIEHVVSDNIDFSDEEKRKEHIKQIGINLPAAPDFIIPKFGIVGDIKTGAEFKPHFQLTCAGYALAYENVKGKGNDINWGIIYFFPTRNPGRYVKPLTFAQVYIFPIDDYLRDSFVYIRDEAYNMVSKDEVPEFPNESERKHCKYCRFKEYCISQGLEVSE